jgi:hypothetical protein
VDTLLDRTGIDRLRTALTSAGYTAAGVAQRLGPAATASVARNDVRLALRATEERDRLGTLIRIFVCGQTEPEAAVAAALEPLPLADARAAGLVEAYADGLRQGVDLEPYGDEWWVLADVPAALITVRKGGHDDPVVRVEDLRQAVQPPLGDQVAAWFDRQDWLRVRDEEDLLGARYAAADGLRLHQEATRTADGWAVDRQALAMPHGLRWTEEVDPLVLALVGGCHGGVPLRDQVAILAVAHDVPEAELAEAAVPIVARLVERGIITPVGG